MTNNKEMRQAQTHELKADPIPFTEVWEGRKGAEVRRDDRGYQAGDTLWLRETTEDRSSYTGRELHRTITHIQRGYGLPEGIVVLSMGKMTDTRAAVNATAITVWKDGRWKMWGYGDAGYAQNDPDWLTTIHLFNAAPSLNAALDIPMGAIVNGRTLADRVEAYPFNSEAGDLRLCSDWQEFRRCFEALSEYLLAAPATSPAPLVSREWLADKLAKSGEFDDPAAIDPASRGCCQCAACKDGALHTSDCALHNGPAYPNGACDCGTEATASARHVVPHDPDTSLLDYVLQDDLHNRLTPRVIDIAYSAFMAAKAPNYENGGPSDWFNDTRPLIVDLIQKLRKDLFASRAAQQVQAESESVIGVGDGSGNLFVRGPYEAIRRVRSFIFDAEKWRAATKGAKPIYQYQKADGSWIDQTKQSYLNNQQHAADKTRIVYTHTESVDVLQAEIERLNSIINTPQKNDFLRAVSTEAEHQRQRWGSEHDAGKSPADWFWLVGYLAGKALHAHVTGNVEKAEHHIITTAAALKNWHLAMFGKTDMRPGIEGSAAMHENEVSQ